MNTINDSTLGIVTGLAAEARLVTQHHVVQTAARPEQTSVQIEKLLSLGVTRLMSFGLAGGLSPSLPAGALILASHVAYQNGAQECDQKWLKQLTRLWPQAQIGGIWGHDKIVASPQEKAIIHQSSQCLVCDMESHSVAEAAAHAGIPFIALRVVCDPAAFALPSAALLPLCSDGTPHMAAIVWDLLRHPAQLLSLMTLGKHNQRAMTILAQCAPDII
jgi:adenosylhomocysteine nucleosidase